MGIEPASDIFQTAMLTFTPTPLILLLKTLKTIL